MKLVRPNEKFLTSYYEACKEDDDYSPNTERIFGDPNTIIQKSRDYENGINMKHGYVKATTFWLIDNNQFIGEINIRHELTDFLLNYGGHIGYEIRYSMRNKGYGTKMLQMTLPYCKEVLKLQKVLITCDDDNIGSAKVIEKNGGIMENVVINDIERGTVKTRRYWINL
ncbi:MAG: GNAT family N-acetyltransferase [Bacilli bacterium]|nr:GNAT family N-acetyltransferase [Bacilli bacterium]MDD3348917.1 GNAT family N-acetyltransferase [Bacilli bacterium]